MRIKIRRNSIFQGGDGFRNGGEDEVAIFFAVLGEADTGGSPVTAPAEGTGDGVDIHTAF